LNDRDNLWHLLVVITARKAHHLVRHERAANRLPKLPVPIERKPIRTSSWRASPVPSSRPR
jgi:hypothetical protein